MGSQQIIDDEIIPRDQQNGRFAIDHSLIVKEELVKRTIYANKIKGNPRKIFISIHFDSVANEYKGARVIYGKGGYKLAQVLQKEFTGEGKISNFYPPLLSNGDRSHGIRCLTVLGNKNSISPKVLLELGNFNNELDFWRIRDYKMRENYAQIIVRAITRFIKS
jgi:N-acetylmuramoyl-L-alanine amidase